MHSFLFSVAGSRFGESTHKGFKSGLRLSELSAETRIIPRPQWSGTPQPGWLRSDDTLSVVPF